MKNETTIAIADIFTEHGREMQARARRILGSDADAEDAVQEAMVSMLRSPHLLAGVERFGAWLFTLVKRRCVDIVRKDTRRKAREAEVGIDDLFEARLVWPPLSTVRVPWDEMGCTAARMLLARIAEPDRPCEKTTLPETLVIRKSTAPPPEI